MAARLPGAPDVDTFWDNILAGRDTITRFDERELRAAGVPESTFRDPNYVPAKGVVDGADAFDAALFGYSPREARRMDPQLRLLHACVWECLEDAGHAPRDNGLRVGLYVGVNENYDWVQRAIAPGDMDSFLLSHRDYAATRVVHALGLRGPAVTVLTACSTSLVALHLAARALRDGDCDIAVAGGVSLSHPLRAGYQYQEGLMHSADGTCRTFDASASGTVFGDGAGLVALRRLDHALAERDNIRAVVRGTAINNDGGRKVGFTAPIVAGQREVIRAALADANVDSESVGYVEAHGTATQVGDPIELRALTEAFDTDRTGYCAIGSVKTNIGHVNVAAGASALIKAVRMLETGAIPAHLHFETPNPQATLADSPFFVPTEPTSWRVEGQRRAGVSAFGFGGTNAHVVLEQPPASISVEPGARPAIILASANSSDALASTCTALADSLERCGAAELHDAAHTLSRGRVPLRHRAAAVVSTASQLRENLCPRKDGAIGSDAPTRVFVFPGQGSQWPGMGARLYSDEPSYREAFDECLEAFGTPVADGMREVIFGGDTEALGRTDRAQPAIFAVSYALARLWRSWVGAPDAVIGHSVGEIAAACVAGTFSLADAANLVVERARLMQTLPPGRMLAVAAAPEDIGELPADVVVAAYNGPRLSVVSGAPAAIDALAATLRRRRVPARRLDAAHAFHSPMVEPIVDQLREVVRATDPQPNAIEFVSTVTGAPATVAELRSKDYWLDNLRQPVRFRAAVAALRQRYADVAAVQWYEVGPGNALTGLLRGATASKPNDAALALMPDQSTIPEAIPVAYEALAEAWVAGAAVDWDQFHAHEPRRRVRLPTYPFEPRDFGSTSASRPTGQALALEKISDPAGWLHVPSWKRTAAPTPATDGTNGPWLLLADDSPLWLSVIDELDARGAELVVVREGAEFRRESSRRYRMRPSEAGDYGLLFEELEADGVEIARVLHGWLPGSESPEEAPRTADPEQVFYSLLGLAQALGERPARDDVLVTVVTAGAETLDDGDVGLPNQAVVGGPVRVIAQEYANLHCLQLDLDETTWIEGGSRAAQRVVNEASSHRGDIVAVHRRGARWSRSFEPLPVGEIEATPFRDGGVYLITGGWGGLGLQFGRAIAQRANVTLLLNNRSGAPDHDEWKDIEACGSRVVPIVADVCDETGLRASLKGAGYPPESISGVIHAAGIPGEGIIQLKGAESSAPVLAPKTRGTLVLDRLFAEQPLDFMVLCSSIAAVLGGIGLVDYSAANHFLDSFAWSRRSRPWGRLVSINWDMWGEVGMGLQTQMPDELKDWFANELAAGLTNAEGIEVLERIIAGTDEPQVVVSTRDLQERIDLWVRRKIVRERGEVSEQRRDEPRFERPDLAAEYAEPAGTTEAIIAAVWADLFELERIGRHDNFFELGGHSLLAAVMLTMLAKRVDVSVPISAVAEHPTVAELAAYCGAADGAAVLAPAGEAAP